MEQYEKPMCGTLRITNPKTLEKWVQNGSYQQELDAGYIFATGCGRFRTEPCTCCKCRSRNAGKELQLVIDRHYKKPL
jgi:hypothetical protein